MMTTKPTLLAALLFLGAGTAQAQGSEFSWRGTLAAGRTVEIRGVIGDIDVVAATGNTVEVTAVKRARRSDIEEVKVEVVESNAGVTVCAVYPTPRRARNENHCGSGDDYEMSTNDNDVEVHFTVKVPRGVLLNARTVNGDVHAEGLTADAEVGTVNGSIRVVTGGVVDASTVNGSIDATIGRADWTGTLEFHTVNGKITLTAPASLSTDVDAQSVNGAVDSDFPITVRGRMERRHLRGTIGNGGRSLELETVNGGIELRKAP
jgi:putative adhesin